ncbi:hypothetical protein A3844_19535 [Paenibacillus helianthi]|uniref:Antitoxin n=1 Tax=Paenibacillus helianthi TaxID=1349432 RepID=A0ABX3EJX0_9BACL|nr:MULTISPECIES: hypothetical protein [Paenibacillus]OKP84682.1 hypothetical protein A3844_19535 [Paenibacillus helianthi]OKP90232.1 hypothetical protein A3848_12800 [Paenibacillus sp. P32E]
MSDKEKFKDKPSAGFNQIPDASRPGQTASTDKLDDIVGGIMDNVQETLTGDSPKDAGQKDKAKDK